MQKAEEERRYDAWARTRMIAHCVYLFAPTFGKGVRKETDARRWYPLPGDKKAEDEKPEVIHLTDDDIKELNRIKSITKQR